MHYTHIWSYEGRHHQGHWELVIEDFGSGLGLGFGLGLGLGSGVGVDMYHFRERGLCDSIPGALAFRSG